MTRGAEKARTKGTLTVKRICGAPPPESFYKSWGIKKDISRSSRLDADTIAWENAEWVLANPTGVTRFSAGHHCVLYAAEQLETAVSEKGYWIKTSVFSKSIYPPEVTCVEYELGISGEFEDYTLSTSFDQMLVHPKDYSVCHSIGEHAASTGLSFIRTYSARLFRGVNTPVFRTDAIEERRMAENTEYQMEAGILYYLNSGGRFQVVIETTYGMDHVT